MFSLAVISSSAPVSQNTQDAGGIIAPGFGLQRIQIDAVHVAFRPLLRHHARSCRTITEIRCFRRALAVAGLTRFPTPASFPWPPPARLPPTSASTFHKLHESGCFVIPNPWNVGSARYLQGLGFKALATTSSGHAHSQGFADGAQPLESVLAHYREIADETDIPVNADFEDGFAHDPAEVAANVTRCIATGVAGLSIEDFTGDDANPLYDFDLTVARVKAARAAIDKAGGDVVFTARSEGFIRGRPDLDETIRRSRRSSNAGADCIYTPGHQDARAYRSDGEGGCAASRSTSSTQARSASR